MLSYDTSKSFDMAQERYVLYEIDVVHQLWQYLSHGKHGVSLQITNAMKILLLTGVRTDELYQWCLTPLIRIKPKLNKKRQSNARARTLYENTYKYW